MASVTLTTAQKVSATAVFSDGSTPPVTWSIADPGIASLDATADISTVVRGVGAGTTSLTVSGGGVSAIATVTVEAVTLSVDIQFGTPEAQ